MKGCSFFTFHPEWNAWRESVPHTSGIHPLQRNAVSHTLRIEKKIDTQGHLSHKKYNLCTTFIFQANSNPSAPLYAELP